MQRDEYERRLVELCLASEPAHVLPDLARYREMARALFWSRAKVAYRRSLRRCGERELSASFARYLEAAPPRSPFIREVIGGFAAHAQEDSALLAGAPRHARDLLRFEEAVWSVANAVESAPRGALREVDFDGVLVANSTLRVLALDYAIIDARGQENEAPQPERCAVLVYRRPAADDVRWYRSSSLLAEVFARSAVQRRPLGELVQALVAERGGSVTPEVVEELAEGLALAVERNVVLGVS